MKLKKGRLSVVGTGIITPAHLSQQAIGRIKSADVIHALVPDALGMTSIATHNTNIKNLADLYFSGTNRLHSYEIMVQAILEDVRAGLNVCAIFYGHPGVFVYPSHQAIKIAQSEGYEAQMLPSISAEDCLFADLGVDPGDLGCQAYEASQLMFYQHQVNVYAALILWQIGVVGDDTLQRLEPAKYGLTMLQQRLLEWYPKSHPLTLYEASRLPISPPRIEALTLANLPAAEVKTITTLYVSPIDAPPLNEAFCARWNIDRSLL